MLRMLLCLLGYRPRDQVNRVHVVTPGWGLKSGEKPEEEYSCHCLACEKGWMETYKG